ncbi:MAG: hypothetical protein ABUL60_28845 [Myxococcales bacterium]
MKARLPLIAALVVALFPLKASAQAWVSNPDFSEGVGIRAGNLELHPSIGAEFGYDSNYFRSSPQEGPVVDVFKLRVTPSITLATLGGERRNANTPPKFTFSSSANASYHEVIPAGSEEVRGAARRNVGGGVDARLNVFPKGKVGFDLLGSYVRIIETEGNAEDLAGDGFNRGSLRGGGGVTWRPGGGQFEWRVGYQATYHYFENGDFSSFNNLQHDINSRGRWRFLPRSALLFDTNYILVRYNRNNVETDGDLVRARVGFHGLVTYHLALMGLVGWTTSFYEAQGNIKPRQFDSVVAHAEARWFLQSRPDLDSTTITSGLSSIAVGYLRSFSNSYYGSFYQRDRGYLQFSMFLLGAVAGGIEFGVSRVAYPAVTVPAPKDSFSQLRLDGRMFAEYRLTDIWAMNATLQYDKVNSEVVNNEHLDYDRFQAYVGMRLFW